VLLEYIPADTPYAIAGLQPIPAEIADHLWVQAEASSAVWPEILDNLRSDLASRDIEPAPSMLKLLDALEAEFKGKTVRESVAHLGLPEIGVGAVYGIGPLPVARMPLADPAKLEAFIERLQASAGFELSRQQLEGATYWTLPASADHPPLMPLLAIMDGQLVISLHTVDNNQPLLRQLLGLDKPQQSQTGGGELARRGGELGFLPYAVGYVDSLKLLDQLSGGGHPSTAAIWQALEQPAPELDATCRAELQGIAQRFPGVSLGMTRFDADGNAMRSIFHIDPEITTELLKLRSPMPGGDVAEDDAIASFGMALSLQALPGVVSRLAARVTNAPFACKELQGLNELAGEAGKGINNPAVFAAAPVINGFYASIDGFALGADGETPEGEGTLLLGSDNPESLIGMAKGFVPQLAELDVPTDGTPVALPSLPGTPPGMPPLKLALGDHLLGFATGGSADKLSQRLRRDPAYQPLIAGQVRPKLYEIIADTMERSVADQPEGSPERDMLLRQVRMMRETYAKAFIQSVFLIELTERGVEMHQDVKQR
jgi:hypothetical protein